MAQDIDFSGKPTKSDIERMKRDSRAHDRELQDAYESGKEEAASAAPARERSSYNIPVPSGRLNFSSDAQKIIVITMTVTVVVALVENLHIGPSLASPTASGRAGISSGTTKAEVKQQGVSNASIIVGGFVSGGILLAMSYFLPEFASGLSIVAMLATVLDRGKPFWDIISTTSKNVPAITTHASQIIPDNATGGLPNLSPGGGPLPNGQSTSPVPSGPGLPNLSPVPSSTMPAANPFVI